MNESSRLSPQEVILQPPTEWTPSILIGVPLGANISAVERAERQVRQWQYIIERDLAANPHADVKGIESLFARDQAELDRMRADPKTMSRTREYVTQQFFFFFFFPFSFVVFCRDRFTNMILSSLGTSSK
jgi:hypothetical protein